MRLFVLLTCWIGSFLTVRFLWRRGGRGTDLLYGVIAGTVAGLVGSTTVACLFPVLDSLPRLLASLAASGMGQSPAAGPAWLWVPVGIVLALASWTLWGALVGFVLGRAGPSGARMLGRAAQALAWLFQLCGWKRATSFFVAQSHGKHLPGGDFVVC
jgi:hypothetical protein